MQDEALLPRDAAGDLGRHGDAVGVAQGLDPSAPAGRLGVAQPAQAFGVHAERRGVLQRVGDVEDRRCRPGVVEVDEADRVPGAPDPVPGAEVAVADDLAKCAGARAAGPSGAGRRVVACDGVVVAAQERCPAPEPAFWDDLGPPGGTGLAVDPGEQLQVRLGAERAPGRGSLRPAGGGAGRGRPGSRSSRGGGRRLLSAGFGWSSWRKANLGLRPGARAWRRSGDLATSCRTREDHGGPAAAAGPARA